MKRIFLIGMVVMSITCLSQGWLSKNAVRVEDADASLKIVFTDSSYTYLQKTQVDDISNSPGSRWVKITWRYDGVGQRVFTVAYDQITTPDA